MAILREYCPVTHESIAVQSVRISLESRDHCLAAVINLFEDQMAKAATNPAANDVENDSIKESAIKSSVLLDGVEEESLLRLQDRLKVRLRCVVSVFCLPEADNGC